MNGPRMAWLNGSLVPFGEASVPLEDRGLQFGESLYEVVAVGGGQPRLLARHAERMRVGAAELGIGAGVPDDAAFEQLVGELLREDPLDEGIVYAQVTGGTAARRHVPEKTSSPTFFAYLRAHRFPRATDTAHGIKVVTAEDQRWARCDMKSTMLLPAVLARRAALARGAAEVIFLADDGTVREGAASSVALVEGRSLVSPRPTHHVLPGTTGPLVRELASQVGLTLVSESVTLDRLLSADEVFVSSATFLVTAVVDVDGRRIGKGVGGPVVSGLARRLRSRFGISED